MEDVVFRSGDVVLTCTGGLVSGANRFGQLLASGKKAQFTHVALCMTQDVLIDARPFEGVQLRNIFDEVQSGRLDAARMAAPDILVLRNPSLSASREAMDDTGIALVGPLYPQLRKKYNFLFSVPQVSDKDPVAAGARRAFCSELCVLIMSHLTVLPRDWTRPSGIYPAHFQELASCDWRDVTDDWSTALRSVGLAIAEPESSHGQTYIERKNSIDGWIRETEGWAQLQNKFADLPNELSKRLDDLLVRAKKAMS